MPDGYIYLAPGWFSYGSGADEETRRTFLSTMPLHLRHTDGFLVGRNEVTWGDWIAYLEAQPDAPSVHTVRFGNDVRLERAAGGWQLTLTPNARTYTARWGEPIVYAGRRSHVEQDWRKLPVLGISAVESIAYTTWLDHTGRVPGARLCSEVEWERAARGSDGRTTPSGHVLDGEDANIDLTYDRELMGPDEVGTHPGSISPYGLNDTAGNAFEWTVGERVGVYVVRGGSYYHDRKTADLSNRNETGATVREPAGGLRVCATLR